MNEKELQKELDRRQKLSQIEALEANKTLAQSLTIGTAGGGTVEITMRNSSGRFLWNTYQPVEVVELINQLSAGIGCHIHIVPRQDFASWRDWKVSPEELAHAAGTPPFHNVLSGTQALGWAPHPKIEEEARKEVGGNMPHPDEQVGRPAIKVKTEKENVATKKAVNKRSTKRSRTSTK